MNSKTKKDRESLINEIEEQLSEIYLLAKKNGKKLYNINKILNK